MSEDVARIQAELAAPFPPEAVSWRVGATTPNKDNPERAIALAFIDARDVMARFDQVCGVAGWQAEHYDAGDGKLACKIGVRIGDHWIWKSDGAGGRESGRGLSEQDASKGDFSDSLKRAAVMWGVGRYLYSLPAPWVPVEKKGSMVRFTDAAMKTLRDMLARAGGAAAEPARMVERPDGTVVEAMHPAEQASVRVLCQTIRTFCTDGPSVDEFIAKNKGMLAQLRKGAKAEVWALFKSIKQEPADPLEPVFAWIDGLASIDDADEWLRDYKRGKFERDDMPSWEELSEEQADRITTRIAEHKEGLAERMLGQIAGTKAA